MNSQYDYSAVPEELKALSRWLCWKAIPRGNGKTDKVPFNSFTGRAASTTNAADRASFEVALAAYQRSPNLYAGLGFVFRKEDGLVFIDLDNALTPDRLPQTKAIAKRIDSWGELSQSGLGLHLIAKGRLPASFNMSEQHGVEAYYHGRFVAMTGQWFDKTPMTINEAQEAIDWVYQSFSNKAAPITPVELGTNLQKPATAQTEQETDRVYAALAAIPADDYEKWLTIGMALHTTGWPSARAIWDEWSQKSDKFDKDKQDQKWRSFHQSGNGSGQITIGTVYQLAGQHGWNKANSELLAEDWLRAMNSQFAWIDEDASIYRLEYGNFIEPSKLRIQFDNKKVTVENAGCSKQVGRGSAWISHDKRREHKRLVIRPAEGQITHDNCLNEWRGFIVAPSPGSIKPFLRLLVRIFPKREARRFVMTWLAHLIQHPAIKMHVSLAIWSNDQGVGKNLLFEAISSIIGEAHATVIGQNELTNDFNGWANRRIFIIGDEVSSTDRRQDMDKLKGLITGTKVRINEKYQPAREVPNLMNFVFLSNHHDVLFVDDKDRRFFVWEIGAKRLPEQMARDFVQWRDTNGLGALYYFLLNRNIGNFNPKAPAPMTDAKQQMMHDSRSDLEAWVVELNASGPGQVIGREIATAEEIADRYASDTKHNRPSTKAVGGALRRVGAIPRPNQIRLTNGKKPRVWAIERPDYWMVQPEPDWVSEMQKPFKMY